MSLSPRSFASLARALALGLAATLALGGTAPSAQAVASEPSRAAERQTERASERTPATADQEDLADRLRALPGVVSVTEDSVGSGFRFFRIGFTQPVDHRDPDGRTFTQRLSLLHRDTARPMVMYTSGYNLSSYPNRAEPTRIVDGNQLGMEYRFFEPSRPSDPDWKRQLTIWQAATDQHRVIESFKKLYDRNWLTTGGSKGGMTATYHRKFYPADVAGTVPYVAPNDVVEDDDAYDDFLDNVGTSRQCRASLTAIQRRVLGADRQWFRDRFDQVSSQQGLTYTVVGDRDVAFESAALELYFVFWQYSYQRDCASIPDTATASNETLWTFLQQVAPLTSGADSQIKPYIPYFFQAATQLGSPAPYERHLADVVRHPGSNVAATFVPAELKPLTLNPKTMPLIDSWVRTTSRRMLFVNGANDPWSAEPFDCGADGASRACFRYAVPGGNHGAQIAQLPAAQREHATRLVMKWAGLSPSDRARTAIREDGEPVHRPALDRAPDYLRPPGRGFGSTRTGR